ncbi:hypothetical protein ThidrDRAFT_3190 [Thiorhodococcus drewsii AZ1]|uniref:DUF4124 domain-containing protein n=1 Tax=Thiorhodococcus drewsii AZ1 TaxID=765913 RepID=G2E4H7_9GAMM|nr:DUF4124 domain-containing protein [Thiorhodococcus drewsii]EGV29598.1 hypothetical protein ThidrDRAFT_3190 [Thiorhodococcus drewsii AZ1]
MQKLALALLFCAPLGVNADIFKCTTNGSVTYSNVPCEGEDVETYYKDTEYDIQRRIAEKEEQERVRLLAAQQAERERQVRQIIGLVEAGRIEDARTYADRSGLDFDKVVVFYKDILQKQELERQRRLAAQRQALLEEQEEVARRRRNALIFDDEPEISSSRSLSTLSSPQWLHDPFLGTTMPRSGGGYVDPRNGTFYHDVGPGVVNTRTGQFTPTH